MEAAVTEILTQGGGDLPSFDSTRVDLSAESAGAYVSLVGPGHCVRLGVLADRAALKRLASIALMSEPTEVELEDAACDLAKAIAGAVRKFFDTRIGTLRLGLPVYSPRLLPLEDYRVSCTEMSFAGVSAKLLVMLPGTPTAN